MIHRSILLPCQIRMARAALEWTIAQLADVSGVSERTIRRLEADGVHAKVTIGNLEKLMNAFHSEGLMFVPAGHEGHGAGVRFRSAGGGACGETDTNR